MRGERALQLGPEYPPLAKPRAKLRSLLFRLGDTSSDGGAGGLVIVSGQLTGNRSTGSALGQR